MLALAHTWLEKLHKFDCLFLLKLFLNALAAKDCSVLVSMKMNKMREKKRQGKGERLNVMTNVLRSSDSSVSIYPPRSPLPPPLSPPRSLSPLPSLSPPRSLSPLPALSPPRSLSPLPPLSRQPPQPPRRVLGEWVVHSPQSEQNAGILCFSGSGDGDGGGGGSDGGGGGDDSDDDGSDGDEKNIRSDRSFLAYSIGIVDIGMKAISKIQSKMKIENKICSVASRQEKLGLRARNNN